MKRDEFDNPAVWRPASCGACVTCHVRIQGSAAGRCQYGGPFVGYREVR